MPDVLRHRRQGRQAAVLSDLRWKVTDRTIGLLAVVAVIFALLWFSHQHSDTGGTKTCEQEYASNSSSLPETHDQFMQHCVKDFNNYNK